MARYADTRRLLASLDDELAAAARRRGGTLTWTAQERAVLALIGSTSDRRTELGRAYRDAEDIKVKVKLSAELRLLESSLARLLKQVTPDVPAAAESATTRKARAAARARWDRAAGA